MLKRLLVICLLVTSAVVGSSTGILPVSIVDDALASGPTPEGGAALLWLRDRGYNAQMNPDGTITVDGYVTIADRWGLENHMNNLYGNGWGNIGWGSAGGSTIVVISPYNPNP